MVTERDPDGDRPLEEVVGGAVTTLVLVTAFGLLFAGVPYFWVAFPVGFGGVLPLAVAITRLYQRRTDTAPVGTSETDDALADLRERYARGEISDAEFERRVERLLETDTVDDARHYTQRRSEDRPADNRQRDVE